MNRTASVVMLVVSAACTALGQVPALGVWAPALASFGWALAAIAKAQDVLAPAPPPQLPQVVPVRADRQSGPPGAS